jgi:hypothetical protein
MSRANKTDREDRFGRCQTSVPINLEADNL